MSALAAGFPQNGPAKQCVLEPPPLLLHSKNLEVRGIGPGEWELYRKLRLESLRDTLEAFATTLEGALQRSDESWRTQADEAASGDDRAIFFAFSEQKSIGLTAIYRDPAGSPIAELLQVWVAPDARNAGVGTKLICTACEWASGRGIQKIRAVVACENSTAQHLYLSCGVRAKDEESGDVQHVMDLVSN